MTTQQSIAGDNEKIVIITGNNRFGELVLKALNDVGYQASMFTTGAEGVKALYDTMPHLVLLDVALAGPEDGYSVLDKKQAEPLLSKIPVFLMSTQGVPVNMRLVPQGSVAEFILTLQAETHDIVDRIDKHFGHTRTEEKSAAESSANQKTVVWVEDDKLIGKILGKKLSSSGFNLLHANNGEEAFRQLDQTVPDAIVIDLLLPGMNGFEILQKIRADARLNKVPVMILSNLSKSSDIEKAKVLGAQKFLVKATASLDQIVTEVRNICA